LAVDASVLSCDISVLYVLYRLVKSVTFFSWNLIILSVSNASCAATPALTAEALAQLLIPVFLAKAWFSAVLVANVFQYFVKYSLIIVSACPPGQ